MSYKNLLILGLLLGSTLFVNAQNIVCANFNLADHTRGVQSIELTFMDAIVGINARGKVAYVKSSTANDSTSPDFTDSPFKNEQMFRNLKMIYFDDFDRTKAGKIKSIGNVKIDYYDNFDIHDKPGLIKSIDNIQIKYNNTFDIHDRSGTVKSVGPVQITWYNTFDSEDKRGKIKSIKGNTKTVHVTRLIDEGYDR